ncbi:hypothetical protein BE1S18E01_35220 [Acinetobacter sp. BEC1-S18-ESBL-01]|jgi:hypothetical protein|uniref:DUF4365 domain-containing protein n=1 Tax=Acinetobacter TaxID=469 RepID=UPI000A3326FF|nr:MULTISPECIES: DUF4365 domain-containing protein [Acinetobacter]MCU4471204.1 DUF4365 domain-containing protein [Acinetobacter pittii]MCU4485948.1 DUF4365 domain-containing protein [Acinetobacter pittii]MEB3849267.1 DUF4365 domain-containing protein [Acinetobacter pittii]OTK28007.1 DUF4365 domain-containing protein [Acinetobacter pittii]BBU19994.1 hypothetical protein BE1S18E01_35220 [Acinetobacter sp. BEC1-S18-ESBL-01]
MRDLGQLGESTFSVWCNQVGLIANPSIIDRTGWDFYVQFPITNDLSVLKLHKPAFDCKVQVKATDNRNRKLQITLSNLRQMATASMPTFYCFLEFDNKNEVQNAFLLHVDNELVYRILKKIHQIEQTQEHKNLSKKKMTLTYSEQHRLEKLDGENLKQNLLKYIGENYSDYIASKNKYLQECGFEDGYGTVQFSLEGEEGIQKIIDVSLGLEEELDVQNLVNIEKRFGIPSKNSNFEIPKAKLSLGVLPPKKGKIRFKEDSLSSGLVFNIDFYNSPFSFKEYRKFAKFRIIGEFFDMTCEPYANKSNYSFTLGENRRFELKKLKDALGLIDLMSRDNQKIIMELEVENFEPLFFDLKTKFVKRELIIFDDLLNKALQICFQSKIYDEIFISIQELYNYREEIEQFHTIITKTNKCDFRVEYEVDSNRIFEFEKTTSTSAIFCRLGSHAIGAILTIIGKPEKISKNKFRIDKGELIIERTLIFTRSNENINEEISRVIQNTISKYTDEYDVFYNWDTGAV